MRCLGARATVAGLVAFALALACATVGGDASAPPSAREHARLGARIGELMRGLQALSEDRLPRAMDLDAMEGSRREQVEAVALAMVESALAIEAEADPAVPAGPDREEFVRLARQLEADARVLAAAARQQPPVDLAPYAAAGRATCNACHTKFRIPGAPDAR